MTQTREQIRQTLERETLYHLQYTEHQLTIVTNARRGFKGMGNIDDLDPSVYDSRFMRVIACGRGTNPQYGNIDDLDVNRYIAKQAIWVSKGRAPDNNNYAPIDDLDPSEYTAGELEFCSRLRRDQERIEEIK